MKLFIAGVLIAIVGALATTMVAVPEPAVKTNIAIAAVNGKEVEAAATRALTPVFDKTKVITSSVTFIGLAMMAGGIGVMVSNQLLKL